MIKYTRNEDNTYTKAGEFAAAPASVKIQIDGGKPFSGEYTLAQATQIIEDSIRKGLVNKSSYSIIPIPEKPVKPAKEPKAPRVPKVKEPKAPRVPKYDVQQFATIYKNTNSLEDVVKATGASRAYAHRALVKLGLYVKPVTAVVPEVALTEAQEARVLEILAATTQPEGITAVAARKAAIKVLRKEERSAARVANAVPKTPRVLKYDVKQFAEIYAATGDLNQIVIQTGASKVYIVRSLTKLGLYTKPVKAAVVETPAPEVAAPAVATEATPTTEAAPAATEEAPKPARIKKSKPVQSAPPVESSATPKAGKKGK